MVFDSYKNGVAYTLLLGVICSTLLFFLSYSWKKHQIESEFTYRATAHSAVIQKEFFHVEGAMRDLLSNIESEMKLRDHDLSNATRFTPLFDSFLSHDGLVSLAWAVSKPDNSMHVLYTKGEKGQSFNDAIGQENNPFSDHHVKYPPNNGILQSFVRKEMDIDVIAFVSQTEKIVQLSQQSTKQGVSAGWFGALNFRWNIGILIENALKEAPVAAQDIQLFMLHDGKRYNIYQHLSRSRPAGQEAKEATEINYLSPVFDFSGARWQLSFSAAPAFVEARPPIVAWLILLFGIVLTALAIIRKRHLNKQQADIEQELFQRTEEVQLSNKKLQQSNERYSTLVEMSHVGIIVHSEGIVLYANPFIVERLGCIQGEEILKFIASEYQPIAQARFTAMVQDHNEHLNTNESYILKSTALMDGLTSSTIIEYEGEQSILMLIQDVTEKNIVEFKLRHIDRVESLGVLAGGIAHDFNNLLAAATGSVSLLEEHIDKSSPEYEYLDIISSATKVATELCDQMLAYSGKGEFVIQQIDLSHCIKDMQPLLNIYASKRVNIHHQLHSVPTIKGDISQIQQLILNLVINASESMDAKASLYTLNVRIKTGSMHVGSQELAAYTGYGDLESGDYVYINIADNGCGMNEQTVARMFDPYFSTKGAGRGLGMSALLGIIKGHKGGMKVSSMLGQGTDISVIFPCSVEKNVVPEVIESKVSSAPVQAGLALLVDDEVIVRKAARLMLTKLGFKVIVANDGLQAIEVFKQHKGEVSFVLLDLMMPNMGGEECFEVLKKIQPNLCIIISSGYSQKSLKISIDCFLKKPYSLKTLREMIDRSLSLGSSNCG